MKFKYGENVLLALLLLFLELIKRCYPYVIEMVDPLVIKINPEKLEIIPIIVLLNKTIEENRENQKIKLVKVSTTSPFSKEINAIEENKQDQNDKRKIEFAFKQEDFLDKYGKYLITYEEGYSSVFSKTILIYTNDIILKNPKKKYFLTGNEQEIIEAKYDISSIFKDEINMIKYYETSTPNNISILSITNFNIEGNDNNKKLVLTFPRKNSPSSYIFDIFPEYDKDTSNSEIQRFYLYFQDYLLNNDAIYINKNNYTNEVPFNLTFRYAFDSKLLSIREYSYRSTSLNNNNYEITINLGRKYSPGKVNIVYNRQERELFYILYDSNFERCYDKENIAALNITMEWIDEMEYDHILYFNDTTTKLLASSYLRKSGTTVIYKYTYSTLSLNSGIFSLKSTISALNYSPSTYNPVDNKHLYFYLYPNVETFDKDNQIIFSHNSSSQYIYISSSDPDATKVLDEIILKKFDNTTEILVSKGKDCDIDNHNIFYCDLKDIILNFDNNSCGDYSIIYKSKCEKNLTIEGKKITIRRGIGLSDISPKWINKSEVTKTRLILTYDDVLTNRNFNVCFIKENSQNDCKYPKNMQIDGNIVNVTLNDMEEGIYYVRTKLPNEGINFVQEDKSFKVSTPIKFKFNHHYFVKNDNPENRLNITVEDTNNIEEKFGCRIIENIESKDLNNDSCIFLYYPITKIGTIRFSYYDKDGFLIPINDSIIVVSTYSQFFSFNEKSCYYYKFDITIEIMSSYKNKLNIKVFLKDRSNAITLLDNSESNENKYTYKDINSSFFDEQGFDLYISEEEKDDKVYLYKSKVKFTGIETPEFIIDPNKTIVFSNVNCDLNSSTFKIIKMDTKDVYNSLTYWKYEPLNNALYCNISGDFYQANRFRYYYYQIDYNNISNISNNNELFQTFVSKRLNETNFELKKGDTNDYVTITNKEKDFYFPSILGLNTIQELRQPKNKTSYRNNIIDLVVNDKESTIRFNYKLGINDVLKIDYLERKVYEWEESRNLGNSIFYFFNKDNIINGSSLAISPKIFAFNTKEEEYNITIVYGDKKQKNYTKSNVTNCSNQENDILEQECTIDFSKFNFIENKAQSIIINITDDTSNFTEYIDFVYYHLDDNSKKCQTMNKNMNNITLLVDIPNPKLKDIINLTSTDTDIIDVKRDDNEKISFILNGSNINLQRTYLNLYTEDNELDHWFSLQDLGINLLPKYKMTFDNNKNKTYLLPENNQVVKVKISVENNEIINLDDIFEFKIRGEKNKNLNYSVGIDSKNREENTINLIFNLSNINKSEENYLLYYVERCDDKKEFQVDLKISLVTFNLKRKYFVLNNNKNSKYQILTFEGKTVEDKISISVYKNGEYIGEASSNGTNYYLNFTQSSQGDYTFIVRNDGIESPMNETIYVRENLEEILSLKKNIEKCMFSNENKSAIKDFSYIITPSSDITNIRVFQSHFSHNQKNFQNLTSSFNGKDKTFVINYSNEMKNNISLNNPLFIYLTENNDKEQPIYIFNYSYTNIELHRDFTEFIYTDADYILFNMTCKINSMTNFNLNNINGKTYLINCEDGRANDIYNENNNIYKCYLSDDNSKNELLNFATSDHEYGNYNIKYEQVQINKKPFFLSQDIYKADFKITPPEPIDRNININIQVTTPKRIFYFPQVEKLTYFKVKEENNEKNITFKYNSDNYISFDLFIENKEIYTIKKICRKSCSYCKINKDYKEVDCKNINYNISSDTPEVDFIFDKHYIALQNSNYKDNKTSISTLTIKSSGETSNDIQELFYNHSITKGTIERPFNRKITIKRENNTYILENLSKGKYTFQYKYKNRNFKIKDIVLVTSYDYEMFDFTDFSSKCIFYNSDLEPPLLFVSINANPKYDFANDIDVDSLILEIDGNKLYNNYMKGYNFTDRFLFTTKGNYCEYIFFRESNLPDDNFFFTRFNNIYSNKIDKINILQQYYKDNIVFYNHNCTSNNIYIKSSKNPNEGFSLLKYADSDLDNKAQYYDADSYQFTFKTNDEFYLFIGNKKLNTSLNTIIYNSIKDSSFSLYYNKQIIRIDSLNFDMQKIDQFKIDDQIITNDTENGFNKLQDSNAISYPYVIINGTESYVTELRREDHFLDRNTTIKIKKVYLKIERKECPQFTIEVNGDSGSWCISCVQKASAPGEDKFKVWYQNRTCVHECDQENFFVYDKVNYICLDCIERTNISGQVECGCLEGTVKSPVDGVCYLPEDPEIKKALEYRPNTQCYRIDGITHNYCKEETTSKCEIISISGADFPICYCKDGYTGKYCEKKNNEINLNSNIDVILNGTISNKIDEGDPRVISKIRGIIYFIEKDNSETNNININKINLFLEASISCINDAINEEHNHPQIYDVIELSVQFLIYKIKNFRRLRLLEEEHQQDRDILTFILENTHYLNYLANKNYAGSNYNIQTDRLNLISFISYRADAIEHSFRTYIKNMTYNSSIIGYTNLRNNKVSNDNENTMAVLTIFNRKLFNLDSLEDGLIFNFSISDNNINLADLKDFYIYFYSQNMNVNFELANYYQAKNINIYDKYDPCFTDACFTSENFEFDLTQKYRKKNVFQKWSLDSDICRYHSFENASNNIEISCQKFGDFGKMGNNSYNYASLNLSVKKDYVDNQDKVYNLPMRCKKKLNSENYAFWIFLIICILEIIYIIGITILTLGSLRRVSIRKGLYNDNLFYIIGKQNIKNSNDDSDSNNTSLKKKRDEYNNSTNEINEKPIERNYNKTLLESILSNFKELHPISVLCRVSIISPLIMNSWFLIFNILCLFGFNALIYYEGLIEKRIYDKKRNYFDYPMRKEFHKILLSILLQIAFTIFIKLIVLVTPKQYEALESKLRKCIMKDGEINNDIIVRHDDFQDELIIRRLIGGSLMTIIIIFFFYYNVVFCEVYLNTQRNLVFSWVWSLFWEWVIFAPIYIVVISFLEHKKANLKDPLIYYLKRLFFF